MISFTHRSALKEEMDDPSFSENDIKVSFQMIRKVNRYLNGTNTTLSHLKQFSKSWHPNQTITILDIGTGCADIPIQIIQWSNKNNFKIKIFALDLNFKTLQLAKQFTQLHPNIQLISADALHLPFKPNTIDYVLSAMFFHHLSDNQIVELLGNIHQITRHGIIINDLARHRRAYFWITLFSLFVSNSHVRKDAQISVLRGFKENELWNYIENSNVSYLKVHRHFGHRYALTGQKQ